MVAGKSFELAAKISTRYGELTNMFSADSRNDLNSVAVISPSQRNSLKI